MGRMDIFQRHSQWENSQHIGLVNEFYVGGKEERESIWRS